MVASILRGILKIFDFSSVFKSRVELKTPKDDYEAIKSDFEAVGKDLWRASDEFKERYC